MCKALVLLFTDSGLKKPGVLYNLECDHFVVQRLQELYMRQ